MRTRLFINISNTNLSLTNDFTKDILIKKKKKQYEKNGKCSNFVTVKNETANMYHCAIARESNMIVAVAGAVASKPPKKKSKNRQISECSLISAMSYAITVLSTHF